MKEEFHTAPYEEFAALFSILANPVRLQILDYLLTECCKKIEGCCSVTEIYSDLQLSQPLISKHLKILQNSGILCFTRQGTKILYSFATNSKMQVLLDYLSRFTKMGKCGCM